VCPQALSGICRASGEGELDMRIWRGAGEGAGGVLGCADGEEEAAEAVLTAVFLTSDGADLLAEKIPFARETGDLQLRLVVNSETTNIGLCVCLYFNIHI